MILQWSMSELPVGNDGVQQLLCREVQTAWRYVYWQSNGGKDFANLAFMPRGRQALWSTMDCVPRVLQRLCECKVGFQILVSLQPGNLEIAPYLLYLLPTTVFLELH